MKKSVLILAGFGVWCSGMLFMPLPVSAADAPEKNADKTVAVTPRNEQYDLNKDGKLDEQERAAMKVDRAAKRHARLLAKYDVNKNGQLDPDEQAKCDADRDVRRQKAAERRKAKAAEKAAAAAAAAPVAAPAATVAPVTAGAAAPACPTTAPAEDDDDEGTEAHKP